tara:strand:- start:250 stop:474 length:225 start_codon:yes stop_codon:yes gene_type:complete
LFAIIWVILCEFVEDFLHDNHFNQYYDNAGDTFISAYNLISYSLEGETLVMIYFAFTSLTTVGFGDFYPISDQE